MTTENAIIRYLVCFLLVARCSLRYAALFSSLCSIQVDTIDVNWCVIHGYMNIFTRLNSTHSSYLIWLLFSPVFTYSKCVLLTYTIQWKQQVMTSIHIRFNIVI